MPETEVTVMADQILNLSTTEFDRPKVVIDGESYEMRSPDELTVKMQLEIQSTVEAAEGRDEDDLEAGDETLSRQVGIVMVDLPGEITSALSPVQKAKILRAFFDRLKQAIGGIGSNDSPQSPRPSASTGDN